MRNLLPLVLSLVVLALFAYWQAAALREQREQVRRLSTKLEFATLDLQEKCAKQAREEFKLYGWDKKEMAYVLNHYNSKLNKCFMQIEDTEFKQGTGTTNKIVSDAFEGKTYASYTWISQNDKQYWEVPPRDCKVTLPSGEEKICHSSEEFDALVKQYME